MLIEKIKDIGNTDVFGAFNWTGDNLRKYNLVYGWNGSGKTTLSRLFNFLERKDIHIPELRSIEFSIQTDEGIVKTHDLGNHKLNLRVFNEDFVKENVGFETTKAKKILIVGKENLDIQNEIAALDVKQKAKTEELGRLTTARSAVPKLDAILTEAGGEVPKQFGNTPLANHEYYGRSYNKRKVDSRLSDGFVTEGNVDSLVISDPFDLDAKRETVKTEKTKIPTKLPNIADFSRLFAGANDLLETTIHVQDVVELRDDKELRDWVETGYHIHKNRNFSSCKFCNTAMAPDVLDRLSKFFTEELQLIKQEIAARLAELEDRRLPPDKGIDSSKLFPDLAKPYLAAIAQLDEHGKAINASISTLVERLTTKRDTLPNSAMSLVRVNYPSDAIDKYNEATQDIDSLVESHNKRVDTIAKEIEKAARAIELHTIASILRAKDYFKHKKLAGDLDANITVVQRDVDKLIAETKRKKASIQNASLAVDQINAILQDFFGNDQIYLEVSHEAGGEVGYLLMRRGKAAKHLSEGEKNVLALVYFLIKLDEDGPGREDSIVVIDDPVDSQDGIFLFRTFGFVKRQLKHAKQTIILTHNFEFFNLCRDWLCEKAQEKDARIYLIGFNKNSDNNEVKIENLPVLLARYKSEYQYLFSRLYRFSNGLESLDEPLVANVARKILEYFAAFKWSCNSTEHFANIVLNRFITDQNYQKKGTGDFVVKFVNEYSHGQDFSRTISASMLEARPIAQNILKFVELADKEHYDDLASLCSG